MEHKRRGFVRALNVEIETPTVAGLERLHSHRSTVVVHDADHSRGAKPCHGPGVRGQCVVITASCLQRLKERREQPHRRYPQRRTDHDLDESDSRTTD